MDKLTPEQEAEKMYPDSKMPVADAAELHTHNEMQDAQRSAHITAARMYMGEIERLKEEIAATKNFDATEQYHKLVAENEKMRKALEGVYHVTEGNVMPSYQVFDDLHSLATNALKTNTHG